MTIRVLIADDQPMLRGALRMYLSAEPDIEVVGEASDGQEAVTLAERLRPDLVAMDIRMPVMDGLSATEKVITTGARVMVITTFHIDEYVVEALRRGASGFVLKDAMPEELVHAVRVIAAGEALLSPSVTRRLLERFAKRLPPESSPGAALQGLTARERTVLDLVARGLPNREIGEVLHLAPSSVKTHVSHLLAKLNLADRVHLVIFAYEHGLVEPGFL
jgi:DNA-binding NarL/FixJ family response regulator